MRARRRRRLDGARVRDAGPRRRSAGRRDGGRRRAFATGLSRDRRRRRARQQRRDRGGRRIAGARRDPGHDRAGGRRDGTWRLTGEKTWTTWLPNLTHAFVTARIDGHGPGRGRVVAGRPRLGRRRARPRVRGDGDARLRVRAARAARRGRAGRCHPRPAAGDASRTRAGRRRGPGSGSPSRRPISGWGRAPGRMSLAGRSIAVRVTARPRSPTFPSVQLRLGRLDAELRAARIVVLDVARRWDAAIARGDAAGLAAAAADVPLAKLVATRAAVDRDRRGAADRRRPGVPGRSPRARVPRRARRSDQPAARGRRPGRVRPRRSSTASDRDGDADRQAGPNPAAFHYGPGHMIVHGNPPFVEVVRCRRPWSARPRGAARPAAQGLRADGPRPRTGKPGACRIDTDDGPRRLVVAPRKDPETGETYGVTTHLKPETRP